MVKMGKWSDEENWLISESGDNDEIFTVWEEVVVESGAIAAVAWDSHFLTYWDSGVQ